jgi:hypothetical protein
MQKTLILLFIAFNLVYSGVYPTRQEYHDIAVDLANAFVVEGSLPAAQFDLEFCSSFHCWHIAKDASGRSLLACRRSDEVLGFAGFYFADNNGLSLRDSSLEKEDLLTLVECLTLEFPREQPKFPDFRNYLERPDVLLFSQDNE